MPGSGFCYIFAAMTRKAERKWEMVRRILLALALAVAVPAARAGGMAQDSLSGTQVPDSVMEYIFRSALAYADQVKDYEADLYLKGHMRIHKRNRILRYVPSMFRFEKGVNDYLHESVSELHYTAPRTFDRKVRAVSTTFPGGNSRFFDILDYLKFNIYSPVVMDDKILSPLHRSTHRHYKYLLDSVAWRGADQYYKIEVRPRYKSTQLIEGSLWISTADWHIASLDFRGKYDVVRFHLTMRMGDTEQTRYLPERIGLNLYFLFLQNKMEMDYTGWMRYKSVAFRNKDELLLRDVLGSKNKRHRYNLSSSYSLTCDTARLLQHPDSFHRLRPLPLSAYEDSIYRAYARRRKAREDSLQLAASGKSGKTSVFWGQLGDALIRSYDIDLSKVGQIRCSPLINPLLVGYSPRKGLSYRQVFKYNKLFHDGRLLRLAPQVGYNFTKKELYGKVDMQFVYNPRLNASVEVNSGNGNRIYSSAVIDQLKQMPDSTFSFDGLGLDYFKDIYLNLSHAIEVVNGLRFWTGLSMHWRYASKATPEVTSKVRSRYNSFAPRLRIEWTPGQYYYLNGNRKINVGSRYPTFVADVEHGFPLLESSNEYTRVEFSAEQQIKVRKIHSIAYHVGCGFFAKSKDIYFVDYVDFADRNLPQGWNDDIGGRFHMLDGRWYNASTHYVRGNVTYETPFLLLYPVTRLLSFIQKERVYAGVLFMPHLNPYVELGYGVGTHVFDAGVFVGNERGRFTSVGCKFTFELFNR